MGGIEEDACSLEVGIASVGTLSNVFGNSLAKFLHPPLNCLAIGCDLPRIRYIFQTEYRSVRGYSAG